MNNEAQLPVPPPSALRGERVSLNLRQLFSDCPAGEAEPGAPSAAVRLVHVVLEPPPGRCLIGSSAGGHELSFTLSYIPATHPAASLLHTHFCTCEDSLSV